MDWAGTTELQDETRNILGFGVSYIRGLTVYQETSSTCLHL